MARYQLQVVPSDISADMYATPRVQVSVYIVSACWRSELGLDTPSRYLASAGIPVHY